MFKDHSEEFKPVDGNAFFVQKNGGRRPLLQEKPVGRFFYSFQVSFCYFVFKSICCTGDGFVIDFPVYGLKIVFIAQQFVQSEYMQDHGNPYNG